MTEQTATSSGTKDATAADPPTATVSVVISAYTLDRWSLTKQAVEGSRRQTLPVERVVLCIDDNDALLERARSEWGDLTGVPVEVLTNRTPSVSGEVGKSGSASSRNAGAAVVTSDVVAFLDDDARPEPDWIEQLMTLYENPSIVAVGGAPVPAYEVPRPSWYPLNFDWVFGCAWDGLPDRPAPLRRLIGANMSVRRDALERVGGFGVDYPIDDLELCLKLAAAYGGESLYYTPRAIVHHYVSADRVTWKYFWRRCFSVSREKVSLYRRLGPAANTDPEREFVWHMLRHRVGPDLKRGLSGEPAGFASLFAMFAGIALAVAGRIRGWADRSVEA